MKLIIVWLGKTSVFIDIWENWQEILGDKASYLK